MPNTRQCRVAWAAAGSTLLTLTAIWPAPKEKPFPPAPQWQSLGSVDIVPCPKRIDLSNAVMPLAGARLLYLPDEDGHTATGAGEIASRCVELGGEAPPSSPVDDPVAMLGTLVAPAILIGYGKDRVPLPDLVSSYEGISAWDEEQGYIIATHKVKGHDAVVVWGREPVAALYGCITLRHLMSRDRERVVLRLAQVVDWPDFKRRITSGFFGARKDTDADIAAAMATAKRFIRRAALLKCNSITPSKHWSVRTKLDYLRECDLKLLERLTPYARSYGVRFYVHHMTSVGIAARDKGDPRYAEVPNLRGFYMSWSHEDLVALSMERFRREARRVGSSTDWFFHYPDLHEGGWPQRSEKCRERWGDDHAGADAYFGNRLYETMKSESPASRIDLCCYPYGLDLGLPGNVRTLRHFERLSSQLPADARLARREGSRAAFRSWWRHIKQPISVWWSPRTFWGARALSPDIAFLKSAWRSNGSDAASDCLTIHSRPVLDVSGYTFAEYTWNVSAPGSGVWRADAKQVGNVVPLSTPGNAYVFERILSPDGKSSWGDWVYLGGRHEPRAFSYDLVERCCRLIYGRAAAPAMAEALRYAPLVQESKWSSDPDIAAALAESAGRSFLALAPLWGQKELFGEAPGSLVNTYGVYTQMVKVSTDLRAILRVRAAKIAADAKLDLARNEGDPARKRAAAGAAAESASQGLEILERSREELREAYRHYGLEGKPWYLLLAAGYRKCAEVERKLDAYAGGFQLVREEAEAIRSAPPNGERRRAVLLPKRSRHITIDGNGTDWRLLNPVVIASESCSKHVAPRPSGNSDCSAIAYLAWDKKHLYVLAKVVDDHVREGDALCLWLNGNHFAVGLGANGTADLQTYSGIPPTAVTVAIERVAAHDLTRDFSLLWKPPEGLGGKPGYVVELQVPWEPLRVRAREGNACWLALGLCDLDPREEAAALVFPSRYKPIDSGGMLTDFAAATLAGDAPIRFELLGLRGEDRAMQVGTDSFVHASLLLESPVELTSLRVRFSAPGDDGGPIAAGLVPGVPGILRAGKPWRSEPFELNAGRARKRVPLVFTVTADAAASQFEVTVE